MSDIEAGSTVHALEKNEFVSLQIMAFVFLQHRQLDKAGILLKTLHHIMPHNREVRMSFAFVLTEFELLQEAEEMLAPLLEDKQANSTIVDLLNVKLKLARRRSEANDSELQQREHAAIEAKP